MKPKEIRSESNPFFKKLQKLTSSRGIRKFSMAFLSGPKNVKEVLEEFPSVCIGIICPSIEDLGPELWDTELPSYVLPPALFGRLDVHNTKKPLLIVRVAPFDEWSDVHWPRGCTLFLPFQDPANVGAAIRSAAAFGVKRVVLLKEAAHPFHPKSLRAAGSSVFRVSLLQGPFLADLVIHSVPLVVLCPGGRNIATYSFPQSFALLAGLEGPGLPKTLTRGEMVGIPMQPGVDSLNAALSVGIALYQWRVSMGRF
ncbi:MAG: hypothetical protein DRG63_01185 [Deltaproteobacteria bacterium]|nr:MAG: hypothetical protein DRG63_01185 [Deltaproteobacteria bacterium]